MNLLDISQTYTFLHKNKYKDITTLNKLCMCYDTYGCTSCELVDGTFGHAISQDSSKLKFKKIYFYTCSQDSIIMQKMTYCNLKIISR